MASSSNPISNLIYAKIFDPIESTGAKQLFCVLLIWVQNFSLKTDLYFFPIYFLQDLDFYKIDHVVEASF